MDTSDAEIEFDADGRCQHCREYEAWWSRRAPLDVRERELSRWVDRLRAARRGDYDCVIGLSGGVDSTFVAWKLKALGLRPLAVHLDNGWDSELAVSNIEQTVRRLSLDLTTVVLDWDEFRDLQLAFLRASVPDIEIPTDHAILASLYHTARKHGVTSIVTGVNGVTERIMPRTWSYGHRDWRYIQGISGRFGTRPLATFPHLTLARRTLDRSFLGIGELELLDLLDYDKASTIQTLERELGWRPYGGKHHESIYTRFVQSYVLPRKFGIDKRRAHLSCLVCSGQLSREAALRSLEEPIAPAEEVRADREYTIKKLGITSEEFDRILALPPRTWRDYPTNENLMRRTRGLVRVARALGILKRPSS